MAHSLYGPASGVAAEIARYLDCNPLASDNLVGVIRCWLNRDPSAGTREVVEFALLEMVARGEVERLSLPDGGFVYRRARRA